MKLFKICPDCGVEKAISEFSRNADRPDGLQFYCKDCYSQRAAAAYRRKMARIGKTVREKVHVPPGHKRCPACRTIKPQSEWGRARSTRDGLASECRSCRSERGRRDYLRRTFGLTLDERDAMVADQGGVCAICLTGEPKHIDHDHETGRVRGILCGPCNMGLGLFGEEPVRLLAAIRYLAQSVSPLHVETYEPCACHVFEIAGARLHLAA